MDEIKQSAEKTMVIASGRAHPQLAQEIAGVPLLSGAGFRAVVSAIIVLSSIYLYHSLLQQGYER